MGSIIFHVGTENPSSSEIKTSTLSLLPLDSFPLSTFATTALSHNNTSKGEMAEVAATTPSPASPDTDVNMARRTACRVPLLTGGSNRVKIVCLSGPIKIIVPLSPDEEMGDLPSDAPDLCDVGANPVDNNMDETVQSSHPIDTRAHIGEVGDVSHMNSASDLHATSTLSAIKEKNPSAVKQPDCNHPDETVSPLSVLSNSKQ